MKFKRFEAKLWNVITSLNTSAAVTNIDEDSLTVSGNFRVRNDLVALIWYSKDPKDVYGYAENKDYTNNILTIVPTFSGYIASFDDYNVKPTLTIRIGNTDYYVTLGFYSPLSDTITEQLPAIAEHKLQHEWIDFLKSSVTVTFIAGIRDSKTGTINYTTYALSPDQYDLDYALGKLYVDLSGYLYEPGASYLTITYKYHTGGVYILDFNNLYQGEHPSQQLKIPTDNIDLLFFVLVPPDYDKYDVTHYNESKQFTANIQISASPVVSLDSSNPNENISLQYSICEGYDDEGYRTPQRLIESEEQYGFKKNIDLYIGATHYYDKVWNGSSYDLITAYPFNQAFANWIQNFLYWAKQKGRDVVLSFSFEMYEAPPAWLQKAYDGTLGQTGWQPPTKFLSPTNTATLDWQKNIISTLIQYCNNVGITPRIQIGEPWWWWQEFMPGDVNKKHPTQPPCFYDNATVSLYQSETGKEPPAIQSSWCLYNGDVKNFAEWLNSKLKRRITDLVDYIHSLGGEAYLLYFPPSVEDLNRVPRLMYEVNNLRDIFSIFDVVQIEDYDWVTSNNFYHTNIYFPALPASKVEYFAGYAATGTTTEWALIQKAAQTALSQGFKNVYIWSGTQIRRDGKLLVDDILPWATININLMKHRQNA